MGFLDNFTGGRNDDSAKNENVFDTRVKSTTRLTMRAIVGGYIAFMGWKLATGAEQDGEKPVPPWLRVTIGVAFVLAGVAFIVYSFIDYRRREAEARAAEEAAKLEQAAESDGEEETAADAADVCEIDAADSEKLAGLLSIYNDYIEETRRLRESSKPTDGLLGLGSSPKDAPCHEAFYNAVAAELDSLAEEITPSEAYSAARYVLKTPALQRVNGDVFPMMYAATGLVTKLVPKLAPRAADALAIEYSEDFPKPERMPAQEAALRALYDRARENAN